MSDKIVIIIKVEGCDECPFLEMTKYNEFRCHLFDTYLGKEKWDLTRCKECEEEYKETSR